MKIPGKYIRAAILLAMLCISGYYWWLVYATLHPLSMTVTGFQGSITIDGKPLIKDNISMQADGADIQVAKDSILNLKLSDGSYFQVFENSSITIQEARRNKDASRYNLEFILDTGEVVRNIPAVRKSSRSYSSSLFTSEVNIGVRGTRYGAITENRLTKTMVYRGQVALATEESKDTLLEKNYGTLIPQGKGPETPSKLPDPPELNGNLNGERIEVASLELQWQPTSQAKHYLIEVARDREFNNIVYREQTDQTSYTINQLPYDASYYWHIASIDSRGLRGHSSGPDNFLYKYHHKQINITSEGSHQQLIDRAYKGFPKDPALLIDIARYLTRDGKYEHALKYYDLAIQQGKSTSDVLLGRGTTLRLLGRRDEAEADFSKVLSMPTDGSSAFYGLGLIELERGRPEKAIDYFYQVIALNPDHDTVHISTAKAWEKLGKIDKAIRHRELHKETKQEATEKDSSGVVKRSTDEI